MTKGNGRVKLTNYDKNDIIQAMTPCLVCYFIAILWRESDFLRNSESEKFSHNLTFEVQIV